jgi:hypothetical protein
MERNMPGFQPLSRATVEKLAAQHDVSPTAIEVLAAAIAHSGGGAAQFNHPELGGMGQWMTGGMLMIGDMFNHQLKAKVDRLCHAVAEAVAHSPVPAAKAGEAPAAKSRNWWPAEFGAPSSVGAQNDMRYAFFPSSKRLVLDDNGSVSVYDTGKHVLNGVSQQQSGTQSITFSSASGPVPLSKLKRLSGKT